MAQHVADIFDALYHDCMHMSSMCAHIENQTRTPGSVRTMLGSPEIHKAKFYFKSFPFPLLYFWGVFCPVLDVPPVVCHVKMAQLLLH